MSFKNHYPLPSEKPGININEIIIPYGRVLTDSEELFHHQRRLSRDVTLLKSQYFIIEKELLATFDYVYPIQNNLKVFSSKFTIIIKNACNLFELICRNIYNAAYGVSDVNIYNYLSLDSILHLNNIEVESEILESEFPKNTSNVLNPFNELQWDKNSPISEQMVPQWWISYNKIKHDMAEFPEYATMENAIRATAAVAYIIYKIYGAGVVLGKMTWFITVDSEKRYYFVDTEQSTLFHIPDGKAYFTY